MPSTRKKTARTASDVRVFVAYYRVSTIRQGESGLGLEAQRAAVARYLAGCGPTAQLAAEFTEVESGKRHTNRPELAAAIGKARKAGATLIIAKLDRLARNVHFISGLMESAADFVACDMPQANPLTLHIMAAMAEHEREMISSRTVAGLAQVALELAANGFRISKAGRKFTKLGNPRWQESIAKATAARRRQPGPTEVTGIIAAYRQQGLSLRIVADRLNGLGIKTAGGAAWYPSSVRAAVLAAAGVSPAA